MSSPATNHSSPASTPKRVPMGPIIVPPGGHSVPSTPPVVTIAPTKTVNGVWRSESRQVSGAGQGAQHLLRGGWIQASVGGSGAFKVEFKFQRHPLPHSEFPSPSLQWEVSDSGTLLEALCG